MNLKHKSDDELIRDAQSIRQDERDNLAAFLYHMIEIERRDIYLARGCSSMNEYLQKYFRYSQDEASFRVSAMHLFKSVPESEPELRSGRITLTHLARTQRACRKEDLRRKKSNEAPLSHDEKVELIEKLKTKEPKEFATFLATEFPELNLEPELIKPVSATHTLVKLHMKNEIVAKLQKLNNLFAHKNFERSFEVLFDLIAEIALDQIDPQRRHARRQKREKAREKRNQKNAAGHQESAESEAAYQRAMHSESTRSEKPCPQSCDGFDRNCERKEDRVAAAPDRDILNETQTKPQASGCRTENKTPAPDFSDGSVAVVDNESRVDKSPITPATDNSQNESGDGFVSSSASRLSKNRTRVVPVRQRRPYQKISLRDAIYTSADGQCEFVDAVTGERCSERHAPQVDHVIGFALGGSEEPENLRLLCWAHNQYEARKIFGNEKTKRRQSCRAF